MLANRLITLSFVALPFAALATLLALLVVIPPHAPTGAAAEPVVETARLDNGMEIIVIPDHRAEVVTHMVWYRVGSADEVAGKSGIAHFFEHLMFRGTQRWPDGTFSERIAALGGHDNAFTSYDYTAYFQRIARGRLGDVMAMEADRMQNLIINPEIVAVERDVILQERSSRVDTRPSALLAEAVRARLHTRAYGVPVIGWRAEIGALNAEDAAGFYKRYYAPDNAVLVVAGDVSLVDLLPLAQKHYGALQPQNRPREPRPQVQKLTVKNWQKPEIRRDGRVRQPQWSRYYRLPVFTLETRAAFAALDVGLEILAGGTTSRLYQRLVVRDTLAVGAGAYSDTVRLNNGEVVVYANPQEIKKITHIAAAIDAEIEKLLTQEIAHDELARAKTRLSAELIYARDSQQSMAQIFGANAVLGIAPRYVLDWPQEI